MRNISLRNSLEKKIEYPKLRVPALNKYKFLLISCHVFYSSSKLFLFFSAERLQAAHAEGQGEMVGGLPPVREGVPGEEPQEAAAS
jgi:hypothetical protein